MKKFIGLLFFTYALNTLAGFTDLEKVEINPEKSKLIYIGKKVTGQHNGEAKIKSGHLNFKKDQLFAGEFVIDMSTISNMDITDNEYLKKFIEHINSADFFDTAKFKTAELKIKTVKRGKAKNNPNEYKISADLTIKGITKPVTFDAIVTKENATAKIVFDRTKYGIKFKSGKFDPGLGDKLIYDDVELNVSLVSQFVNTPAPTGNAKK